MPSGRGNCGPRVYMFRVTTPVVVFFLLSPSLTFFFFFFFLTTNSLEFSLTILGGSTGFRLPSELGYFL